MIVYPFAVGTFPPITDIPFHAAETAILRRYGDPAWHFREQFSLNLFDAPYVSMYVVGLSFRVDLADRHRHQRHDHRHARPHADRPFDHVLRHEEEPSLGAPRLGSRLVHAHALGFFELHGRDRPLCDGGWIHAARPRSPDPALRAVGLTVTLLAVFFTHVYRFPFAVAAVIGTAIVMYPATRRIRPVIAPLAIALTVFGIWRVFRRATLGSEVQGLGLHWERVHEMPGHLFGSYVGPTELELATRMMWITVALFGITTVLFFAQGRHRNRGRRAMVGRRRDAGPTRHRRRLRRLLSGAADDDRRLVVRLSARNRDCHFHRGGAFPDMPRQWWLKVPILGAIVFAVGPLAFYVASAIPGLRSSDGRFSRACPPRSP